jgi:transposase InsO family protein
MPWKETDVLKERTRFVVASWDEDWTMTELCRAFGISRKTGYKLLKRYEECGFDGLRDQPRSPKTRSNETPSKIVELIIEARKAHPNWGPRKLLPWLERRHPRAHWPAPSTVGDILKRHDLVKPRKRRRRATPSTQPLAHALGPNDVWCADFKGWFRTGDGDRCDPLTVMDGYSRYLITCRAVPYMGIEPSKKCFERAFREHGLPKVIRTDNGSPFASTGLGGLTRLSVWWIKLGINPERIEPAKPQQNGRHERMHLTLKQETAMPPRRSLLAQQRAFNAFCDEYNGDRPHESLDNRMPSELYTPSSRRYPRRLPEPEYPGHFEVRKVRQDGFICWKSKHIFLAETLIGEHVGLEQMDERRWRIRYFDVELALLDDPARKILRYPRRVREEQTDQKAGSEKDRAPNRVLPMSPV